MGFEITYFNVKGSAELSRMLFALAGVEVKDNRIEREKWAEAKPNSPLGAMPFITLENGHQYAESGAMARYVANKYGLSGADEEEKLHADMVVDVLKVDILPNLFKVKFEPDEAKKKELLDKAVEATNNYLKCLEAKYVSGTNTFLKSGLSWADVLMFNVKNDLFPVLGVEGRVNLKDYPKLNAICEHVAANEKIKKHVETRPKTDF